MLKRFFHLVDVVLRPVPGWMFVLCGLALVAIGILVPAWEESRKLAWELDLMREQQRRLAAQEQSFKQFDDALAADDPIVIERMAYLQLRLKPIGTDPIEARIRNQIPQRAGAPGMPADPAHPPLPPSVEQLLYKEMPQPGVNYPDYQPINTRLTRLATGWSRLALMAVGLLFIAGGLLASNTRHEPPKQPTDHASPDQPSPALQVDDRERAAPLSPTVAADTTAAPPPPTATLAPQ